MSDEVYLKLDSCDKCHSCSIERYYTSDSFDLCFRWKCTEAKKDIAIVDWHEKHPPIPTWCPLRKPQ